MADPTSPDRGKLLRDPAILEDPDERGTIELLFHQWLGKPELASSRFVAELRQLGVRKAIGFAGRKARVEELTQLLDRDYFRGRCFAHHADLSTSERRRTEEQLRQLPVGLVVATTTLEVGIDIGSVDTCILFDAPPTKEDFFQRAGRSGRRSGRRRVVCVPGLYDRKVKFAKVASAGSSSRPADVRPFLAGVLQQVGSLTVQQERIRSEEVIRFCTDAFGVATSVADNLMSALVRDGWLLQLGDEVGPGEKLLELDSKGGLHRTFAVSIGSTLKDSASGQSLGRAPIKEDGSPVLLSGKGRQYVGTDPTTGAVLVTPTEGGRAQFITGGLSVFERLAMRYSPLSGGAFR